MTPVLPMVPVFGKFTLDDRFVCRKFIIFISLVLNLDHCNVAGIRFDHSYSHKHNLNPAGV